VRKKDKVDPKRVSLGHEDEDDVDVGRDAGDAVRGIGTAAVDASCRSSIFGRGAGWLARRGVEDVLSSLGDLETEPSWLWRFLYGGRAGAGGAISKV
jgi:hypothetical protein